MTNLKTSTHAHASSVLRATEPEDACILPACCMRGMHGSTLIQLWTYSPTWKRPALPPPLHHLYSVFSLGKFTFLFVCHNKEAWGGAEGVWVLIFGQLMPSQFLSHRKRKMRKTHMEQESEPGAHSHPFHPYPLHSPPPHPTLKHGRKASW
jgi:hypothetical protein